jgi:hypothetical protein
MASLPFWKSGLLGRRSNAPMNPAGVRYERWNMLLSRELHHEGQLTMNPVFTVQPARQHILTATRLETLAEARTCLRRTGFDSLPGA